MVYQKYFLSMVVTFTSLFIEDSRSRFRCGTLYKIICCHVHYGCVFRCDCDVCKV